jgi:hypothetical protein
VLDVLCVPPIMPSVGWPPGDAFEQSTKIAATITTGIERMALVRVSCGIHLIGLSSHLS